MQMAPPIPPKHIVLYADDDADDLMLVEETLSNFAYNVDVVTTEDGLEALTYLKGLSPLDAAPCLIILDMNMPRLNGKEALKEIRNLDRFIETPVIIYTTSSHLPDKAFAEKYKAGFITKPLDLKQMTAIAEQFVAHCSDEIKKDINRRFI